MHYGIDEIEAFSESVRECLMKAGLSNTRHLLEKCVTPKGRAELARASGVAEAEILRCVHMADLLRVKGVGVGYAALLTASGVGTLAALRTARAAPLRARMADAKGKVKRAKRLPTVADVEKWIEDAGDLQPIVT